MSEAEHALLAAIRDNSGAVYAREIVGDDCQTASLLVERGYIVREGALDIAHYRITDAGRVALADFEQARQDEIQRRAYDEALAARNRRIVLIAAIVGAIIGSVVTLVLNLLFNN